MLFRSMPPQNFTAPQHFDGGFNQPNFAPPAAFMPPPFKDASGFPVAANDYQTGLNSPFHSGSHQFIGSDENPEFKSHQFDGTSGSHQFDGTIEASSFEVVGQSDATDPQQQPQ